MTNVKTDPAVNLAEAIMADLDCADVFGHRDELIASVRRHLPDDRRLRAALRAWLDTAPATLTFEAVEEELVTAANDWTEA